jgi:hypothetical protein
MRGAITRASEALSLSALVVVSRYLPNATTVEECSRVSLRNCWRRSSRTGRSLDAASRGRAADPFCGGGGAVRSIGARMSGELTMNDVRLALQQWFANHLYPTVVIGTCILIIALIGYVLLRAWSLRVTMAALAPVVAIAFVVAGGESVGDPLVAWLDRTYDFPKAIIGAVAAAALLELARLLLKQDREIGFVVYILLLSSAGMFIVYAIMSDALRGLHWWMFGFVLGGMLHVAFRRRMPLPIAFGGRSPLDRFWIEARKAIFKERPVYNRPRGGPAA